jgi:hypothetical protein
MTNQLTPAGTITIGGKKLQAFTDPATGNNYVQTEGGELISPDGAKVFKSEGSKFPMPTELMEAARKLNNETNPLFLRREQEQEESMREFFSKVLDYTQARERKLNSND